MQFTYSPTRRWLTRIRTVRPGGTVILDNSYTRDDAGRITAIAGLAPSDSWTYAYNELDWLLGADNAGNNALDESFVYQANGNLVSRSRLNGAFTYPAGTGVRPHAPTKLGSVNISYDANGNMTADGTRTLTWDPANRLGQVVVSGGATVTLAYGPDGARSRKTHALGDTLYPSAAVEIDNAGAAAAAHYTRYPHAHIKIVGTGTKQFLHRDHLASVRHVTDTAGEGGYAGTGRTATVDLGSKIADHEQISTDSESEATSNDTGVSGETSIGGARTRRRWRGRPMTLFGAMALVSVALSALCARIYFSRAYRLINPVFSFKERCIITLSYFVINVFIMFLYPGGFQYFALSSFLVFGYAILWFVIGKMLVQLSKQSTI